MNWRIEAKDIAAHLPEGLEPECFDGSAWISIVPFEMARIRFGPLPPLPGLSHFPELNLRTYVRHRNGTSGIWFFSLEADHGVAVTVARVGFNLPYHETSIVVSEMEDGAIDFRALRRHPAKNASLTTLRYRYKTDTTAPQPAEVDSLEAFLCERYRFFSYNQKRKLLCEGLVRHAPYSLCPVDVRVCDAGLLAWNQIELPGRPPDFVIAALPVEVKGSAPRHLD